MKTEKNIFIAFILNLIFSIIEFFGGIITGSVAILSDATHDIGDALSLGLSFYFEKLSKKAPDEKYTFGYLRYSVIGSIITTAVLLIGSVLIIINSVHRIIYQQKINYSGMVILAVAGACINYIAAYITHKGGSLNQKAVNLHMLEDVLGWVIVLIGAVIMKFTGFTVIDPIMSIGVSIFIFINALKNFKKAIDIILEKTPDSISIKIIKDEITKIDGIINAHHIHIWSMDGQNNYASIHIVTNSNNKIKEMVREIFKKHGISHITIELEKENDICTDKHCNFKFISTHHH